MSIENKISSNIRMNRLLPIYDNKDLGITQIIN